MAYYYMLVEKCHSFRNIINSVLGIKLIMPGMSDHQKMRFIALRLDTFKLNRKENSSGYAGVAVAI